MRRFDSKSRKTERQNIEEAAREPCSATLETGEALTKLYSGKNYNKTDIATCAQKLFQQSKYSFEEQFKIVEDLDEIPENLVTSPTFFIYPKSEDLWVVFGLVRTKNDEIVLLYKDSSGCGIPQELEDAVRANFASIKILVNLVKNQDEDNEHLYGPLSLRNLKIFMELHEKNCEDFVSGFGEIRFCSPESLNRDRFNNVITITSELSQNEEFKQSLREFIDKLPLELGSGLLEYKRIMEEELEKDEEDVDLDRIKSARQQYMAQETIDSFRDDYKLSENDLEGEARDFELDIQKNFPEEMKKLGQIFEILDKIKVDDKLLAALENISDILEIDKARMRSFYEFKVKKEDRKEDPKLAPMDINQINLPEPRETSTDNDCTPLSQLLEQITLGMDPEDAATAPKHDTDELLNKYNLVKTKYETWKNRDIGEINNWAKTVKPNLGSSDSDICETIAAMDRALNLLTGGHRLRDTQILSVLIFFHDASQGRLCQIKTGEGKTVIVSLLAVIRSLQGYPVDVITSNPVLADDGVKETETFYSVFGLTVATNNYDKIGYTADILYGTISNFQFDYLKDSFEGFNIRRKRKFGQVILDEVDSMLVDNGGHIAKLASPYPGMECLKYIYIRIWQKLSDAEEEYVLETRKKIEEIPEKYPDADEARTKYHEYVLEAVTNEKKVIKEKIKASNPVDGIPLIPSHLKEYIHSKLDTWISNAMHAKYNCHEHQQYRITRNDSGEKVVTPVDYLNTGVTLRNTIWSNGLHQFVQLKHNLHLTFESLTSSFISNIGYINNYDDKLMFGLTGTLGSRAEQQLLSDIYKINYAKLPTYKLKKFQELPGLVLEDAKWHLQLTAEVLEKIDEARAVLVICETEQDLLTVKKNLEILKNDSFNIRVFANEENSGETRKRVKIGDIILATNIAGRGTNFRTEKDLEGNGGLHVVVAFLPCNLRVEGQAFGRTSRQGNNGTAQLIIRQSEVDELGIIEAKPSFAKIKQERDRLEKERLEEIKRVLVKELNFKDELFGHFSEFHRNLKKEKMSKEYRYVLQDLKEFWAFWLEKKNFKAKNIDGTDPKKEFDNFVVEARGIVDGNIEHNPYYCIALAEHYLENDDRDGAIRILQRAISLSPDDSKLLAGAHLKLFQIAIMNGHQLTERFKKALANIFFFDPQKDESYKRQGLHHLEMAKKAIVTEIEYIQNHLSLEDPGFTKILKQDQIENPLLKHLHSRLYCLQVHEGNVDELIANLQSFEGVDINGTAETTLENLDKMDRESKLSNYINEAELKELHSVGLDTIYSLKQIHDVDPKVIGAAQGQILGGIGALVIGLCFLPIFPLMSSIGGTLISEGIMDLVMNLISQGDSAFNESEFNKSKFISYGISILTFGISALTQSVTILSKAVSFCRKLSSFLRKSKYLKTICDKLANLVDKIGDMLEGLLTVAKFNKMTKAEQLDELTKLKEAGNMDKFNKLGGMKKLKNLQKAGNVTRKQLATNFVKDLAVKTGKKVANAVIQEQVIKPIMKQTFEKLVELLRDYFKDTLRSKIRERPALIEKLRTAPVKCIDAALEDLSKSDEAADTAKTIGFKILDLFDNIVVNVLTLTYDTFKSVAEIVRYAEKSASCLDETLQNGDRDNNVDYIIEDICEKLAEKILAELYSIVSGNFSFGKGVVVEKISEYQKKLELKREREEAGKILSVPGELDSDMSVSEMRKALRIMNLNVCLGENQNDPNLQEELKRINSAYQIIAKSDFETIRRTETANF